MRTAAHTYFAGLYEEDFQKRLKLDGLNFKSLAAGSRQMLESEFTEEEIYESLKLSNGDKALGPDGFNMKFLQEF